MSFLRDHYNDHDPPHFHVVYNEPRAVIAINDSSILFGDLPRKAIGLVTGWARLHKTEEWRLCQQKQPLNPISPLA